jgi:hypothetical protein
MATHSLSKRVDALEARADEARRCEQEDILRTELVRRYAAEGLTLAPDQVEAKVARALVLAEHMAVLAAGGLTLEGIARRLAVEHDLEPDRVVSIFRTLQTGREGRA